MTEIFLKENFGNLVARKGGVVHSLLLMSDAFHRFLGSDRSANINKKKKSSDSDTFKSFSNISPSIISLIFEIWGISSDEEISENRGNFIKLLSGSAAAAVKDSAVAPEGVRDSGQLMTSRLINVYFNFTNTSYDNLVGQVILQMTDSETLPQRQQLARCIASLGENVLYIIATSGPMSK